ncbi:MAG: penicillin-binding protein 2 [Acidimicrobiales bacterium]|nr:penicillin-binding protein 2 [Acidimicrobiales bacterium]
MIRRPQAGGREVDKSGRRGRSTPGRYSPKHGLGSRGRIRAFALLIGVAVIFAVICGKLVVIQGFESASYLAAGGSEWEQTIALPGERGAILDRNGYELAMSVPQTSIYANPRQVSDPRAEAAALSPVLGVSQAVLENEMSQATTFVYLARTITDAAAKKVAGLNLAGVYSLSEPKRFYPAGQLAQPLLGSVGMDGNGLGALEYKYNPILQGRAGKETAQIDPQGRLIPGGVQDYQAPVAGQDLVLSIDEPLQYQAEQALAQAVVAARAHSGIALLMNSKTGEILADAELTMPAAGSNQPPAVPVTIPGPAGSSGSQTQPVQATSASSFTNVYEPGSVNKLITISAALQLGIIKPSDQFTIPNSYPVSDAVFHDAESHPTERWTVTDILANSSNIGTIQIAQRLGRADLMKFINDYQLGSVTDIGFPGESAGLLPSYWSGTSIADVPIGQGIAVTAMQMLAAYNTIANGGVYVPPRLVDATIDGQGRQHPVAMTPQHRVVSATVAKEMTTMLDEVVRVGTGTAANLDPYTVAGKTGTGLVPGPTGGYEAGHYVASFAGFVPAEDPQITGMVVVDDTPDYGAAASAPTFATIARDALEDLSIPPMPKQAAAPGVPLATAASATGADYAGAPIPGLSTTDGTNPATTPVTPVTPSTPVTTQTTPTTTPTSSTTLATTTTRPTPTTPTTLPPTAARSSPTTG